MNHNLDSISFIQSLDKEGISTSIAHLPQQVKHTWKEFQEIQLPEEFAQKKNVVVSGMGGSALGGRVIQTLFNESLLAPIVVSTESSLPNWVNSDTLVIISSYSGNTAETIEALFDAQKKHASIFIIATGGKLAKIAQEEAIPAFIFDPTENPSNMPRMALGYSITSIIALLAKCKFLSIEHEDIDKICSTLEKYNEEFGPRNGSMRNLAKLEAQKSFEKSICLISSQHIFGVAHAFKNQLNENAKTFATSFDLPELGHHFIEGLQFPYSAKQSLHLLFFESKLYKEEYQKRYPIIKEIVEKNRLLFSVYHLQANSKLEQAFEALIFGSYVSFYLAILNGIDPAPIPMVDFLKSSLES